MRVLGLDPSLTNFGWAVYDDEGPERCPARGRYQTSAKSLFVDRYVGLREALRGLVDRLGVQRVGVEHPVFGSDYSEGMWGVFLYTCEALKDRRCDVVFFSPGQSKAHARLFLNRPTKPVLWKMDKPDMVEAAKKHAGRAKRQPGVDVDLGGLAVKAAGNRAWNHNEADAYWIAVSASRFWRLRDGAIGEIDLTAVERQQFLDKHTFVRGERAGKTEARGIAHREDERFFLWSKGQDDGDEQGEWEEQEGRW